MKSSKSIAKPYAKALYLLSSSDELQEAWRERLQILQTIFYEPVIFQALVTKKPEEAVRLLKEVSQGHVDDAALSLVLLLLENQRIESLPDIRMMFEDLVMQSRGFGVLHVTSAVPLTDNEKESTLRIMETMFKQKLRPRYRVDALIRGGIVGRVGDLVFDGSVKGALEKMRECLAL